jgi:hypothetical protein
VDFLKTIVKLIVLLLFAAAIAGLVALLKRPKPSGPTSYEDWPDVPSNPDA